VISTNVRPSLRISLRDPKPIMQSAGYGGYEPRGSAVVMRPQPVSGGFLPYGSHGVRRQVAVMKPHQIGGTFPPQAQQARSMAGPMTPLGVQKTATTAQPATTRFVMPAVAAAGVVHKQQPQARQDSATMFFCTSLSQWYSPEAENSQGLCMKRAIDPLQWQPLVDQLAKDMSEDSEGTLCKEIIDLSASEEELQQKIQKAAHSISQSLSQDPALANLVYQDVSALTDATHKLVPQAKKVAVKLELFGESTCSRWHQDSYVSRGIVSYNCSATEYTPDSNVDFYELKHCGNNDHIIRDKSSILSTGVGDLVLIKGTIYPGKAKALVHKSPEKKYCNGVVVTRLLLKVDVQDLTGRDVEHSSTSD